MSVHGLRQFEAALVAMTERVTTATVAAVAEGAHRIEREAKTRAPVRSGTLRRSIHVDGPIRAGLGIASAKIGPSTVYGRLVELGGGGRTDSLGRRMNQKPHPYLAPGYDAVRPLLDAIFARHWGGALH